MHPMVQCVNTPVSTHLSKWSPKSRYLSKPFCSRDQGCVGFALRGMLGMGRPVRTKVFVLLITEDVTIWLNALTTQVSYQNHLL